MATYEEIYGKRVDVLDSDPTLTSAYEGQVWYNSTSGTLKSVVSFGAWFASTPQIVGGYSQGAAGTTEALISVGRDKYPGPPPSSRTTGDAEEYNGVGWSTATTNPNAWAFQATCGTQTAAITACGTLNGTTYQSGSTKYDGTSWTSNPSLPTISEAFNQFGTQTASIGFGGGTPAGYPSAAFTGDGEGWTAGPNLSNDKRYGTGCTGTSTAGIAFGGQAPTNSTVEELDGTTWTSGTAMPTTGHNMPTGVGAQSSAFALPGVMPSTTSTFKYDGTTWTADASTATPRSGRLSSGGTQTSCVLAGAPSNGTATEEYTFGINTVTGAAWATGGALNTGRNGLGASGTQTAGLAAGGNLGPSKVDNSEEYDGTSWTEGDNLTTARGELAAAGNSPQTASLVFGGTTSSSPDNPGITNASEEYNGTSWSSGNVMNYSSRNLGGLGVQTSAVSAGGLGPPTYLATTGEYDGTNWTAGTSLPAGLQDNQGMTGVSQTQGLLAGGEGPPGAATTATLEYDGTNWTAGGSLPATVYGNGAAGIQTAALSFGGNGDKTATQGYDGTAWSTRPSLATGRNRVGGLGTNTAALAVGGLTSPGAVQTLTEEFTSNTETATAKTLTTS